MKTNSIAKLLSWSALAMVVVPSLISFTGVISLVAVQWCALAGTVVWFLVTPTWMSRESEVDDTEVQI